MRISIHIYQILVTDSCGERVKKCSLWHINHASLEGHITKTKLDLMNLKKKKRTQS